MPLIPRANSFGRINIWKEETHFVPKADRENEYGEEGVPEGVLTRQGLGKKLKRM